MMDRQKQKDQNLETKLPENLKDGSDQQLEEAQEQERIPEGRKMDKHVTIKPKKNTIKNLFATQQLKADNNLEEEVLKEERLATKKGLELKWKTRKEHSLGIKWTEEWLDKKLISPVIETEHEIVKNRMEILVKDILNMSIMLGEGRTSARLDKARRRRENLLMYPDRWWTTL